MLKKSLIGILVASVTAFVVYKYTDKVYWDEELESIPWETD